MSYRVFLPSQGSLLFFRLNLTLFSAFISCCQYWQAKGPARPALEPLSGPVCPASV